MKFQLVFFLILSYFLISCGTKLNILNSGYYATSSRVSKNQREFIYQKFGIKHKYAFKVELYLFENSKFILTMCGIVDSLTGSWNASNNKLFLKIEEYPHDTLVKSFEVEYDKHGMIYLPSYKLIPSKYEERKRMGLHNDTFVSVLSLKQSLPKN
jgi:hypothetical protein